MLGFELGEELSVQQISATGEDGSSLIHTTRVHTHCALRDNGQVKEILLGNIVVVCLHDGQRTGADESSTAGDTPTRRHIPIHQDLHTRGRKRRRLLLAQELQCAHQSSLVVVHPLMLLGVDLDIGIPRHGEFARRELVRGHVGNLHHRL